MAPQPSSFPQCWGHRGASALWPENTLAAFQGAIKDGCEGLESDVHVTSDDVILCMHDPALDRTTTGSGLVKMQPYLNGIDKLLTTKQPAQPIPTFHQTLDLLMKPENRHVTFNIDVKVDNVPDRLFGLMRDLIVQYPDYETVLAPRLILGLWHPSFLEPAKRILPFCGVIHIGLSIPLARKYFWKGCDGFSMAFACLVGRDGEQFRKECKAEHKKLYVWTVNKRNEMIEATKFGVDAVLTDRTNDYVKLRNEMQDNWPRVSKETTSLLAWSDPSYFSIWKSIYGAYETFQLQKLGGTLSVPVLPPTPAVKDDTITAPPMRI